jgi:Bax protein
MYNQKKIIKILAIITAIQFILFLGYYIYTDLQTESSSTIQLAHHKNNTATDIKKEKKIAIVKKRIIQESPKEKLVKSIKHIAPSKTQDIVHITSRHVQPILYTNSIPLSSLTIPQKKQKFIDMMIPSILVAKQHMREDKERVASLIIKHDLSTKEERWLESKRQEFQAIDNYELHDKMESHPTSIVIAQAIIESGWGTSRFFQKANNVFGIWSFSNKDNRIAASEKRGKKTIYLKKYTTLEQSIYDYFVTLAKKDNYKLFQKNRLLTEDPYQLVNHLLQYSERGEKYTTDLKTMIRQNNLITYDTYILDLQHKR